MLLEQRLEQVTSHVSTALRKGDEFVTSNASVLAADLQEFFCDSLLSHSDAVW